MPAAVTHRRVTISKGKVGNYNRSFNITLFNMLVSFHYQYCRLCYLFGGVTLSSAMRIINIVPPSNAGITRVVSL